MIVEGDDGADELSQLHEVSRDDVDAALSGSLRPDPLHHAWQGSVGAGRRRTHSHPFPEHVWTLAREMQNRSSDSDCSFFFGLVSRDPPHFNLTGSKPNVSAR